MSKLTANQIRRKWLDFFVKNDHFELSPVSLIPINDPTLLWINSGVATLKNYFSGKENPPYKNLTNSQKAIRTNDIENVGVTSRHHTFFEMLGNFSIGGYFKEHAIELAFNFLTKELDINLNKLYFTVYEEDDIAYNKWISLGVDKKHIIKCGKDRNFWDVGSGPCGPCTEIYYDRGEKYDFNGIGEKLFFEDIENDRYVEIWNIVFSEFNNDGNNNYTPLQRKNIDTGAGLERLCCILQDVPTNFDTDLFSEIIKTIAQHTTCQYNQEAYFKNDLKQNKINLAYKVIADHIRTVVMAIADGAVPSNKERGYILRRLIRRIVVKMHFLQINKDIFDALTKAVIKSMHDYYDYLDSEVNRIILILKNEYNIFQKTLSLGFKLFNENISKKTLDKNVVFKLVETYGFPIELIKELATEAQLTIDLDGFNELFKQHQLISNKNKSAIAMEQQNSELINLNTPFEFLYDKSELKAKVVKLFDESFKSVNKLENSGWVVFDKTCFYATSGGQLHDVGTVNEVYEVDDVLKGPNLQHIHHLSNVNELHIGDECILKIDQHQRDLVTKNHSVEHLLHITLVKYIDRSIKQEGAFKSPEKVTFDFQYHQKITNEQLKLIEKKINEIINKAVDVDVLFLTLEEAKKMGAMAYFEEVYKKIKGNLRVIKMGDESIELCGGTHVKNTKDIEQFKIISCNQKGAGSYRIEAITSFNTIKQYTTNKQNEILAKINEMQSDLNAWNLSNKSIEASFNKIKIEKDIDQMIYLMKEVEAQFNEIKLLHHKKVIEQQISTIKNQVKLNKNNFVIETFENFDNKNVFMALSECINEYTNKIFLFVNYVDNKTQYLIACNEQYAKLNNINLNTYIKSLNELSGGKGGGKPHLVQGGANNIIKILEIKNAMKKYM